MSGRTLETMERELEATQGVLVALVNLLALNAAECLPWNANPYAEGEDSDGFPFGVSSRDCDDVYAEGIMLDALKGTHAGDYDSLDAAALGVVWEITRQVAAAGLGNA